MYNFLQPRTGAGGFLKLMLAGLVLQVPLATAQFTQVMGTVVDPQGLPYSNGTIFPNLIISGSPRFSSSGFPYVPPGQPTALDSHGSFVMSIADVTQLTPSGGVWSFTVNCGAGCIPPAAGAGPITFTTTGLIISGTVQDISSVLQLAAPPLTGGPGGGVGLTPGATGQFLFFTSPNTATGTPALLTTPPTGTAVTATVPISFSPVGPGGLTPTPVPNATTISTATNGGLILSSLGGSYVAFRPLAVNGATFGINNGGLTFNLNNTSPVAPTNGRNIIWGTSSASISAALVGDGNASNCFNGTGTFASCDLGFTCPVANQINLSTTPATFCAVLLAVKPYAIHCAILYTLPTAGGTLETGFDVDVLPANTNPNFNSIMFVAPATATQFGPMLQSRIFQVGENSMISFTVSPPTIAGAAFFATIDGVIFPSAPTHFDVFSTFDTGTQSNIIPGSYCRLQP